MPLRRFFAQRGLKHPVAYSNATLALGVLMCMVIAISVPVHLNNRALERERAQQNAARAATCEVVQTMAAVYNEVPPTTKTGKSAAVAWNELGNTFHCERTTR